MGLKISSLIWFRIWRRSGGLADQQIVVTLNFILSSLSWPVDAKLANTLMFLCTFLFQDYVFCTLVDPCKVELNMLREGNTVSLKWNLTQMRDCSLPRNLRVYIDDTLKEIELRDPHRGVNLTHNFEFCSISSMNLQFINEIGGTTSLRSFSIASGYPGK